MDLQTYAAQTGFSLLMEARFDNDYPNKPARPIACA